MEKPKQRCIHFTDAEWEEIKVAAKKGEYRSRTHFVVATSLKNARRINSK